MRLPANHDEIAGEVAQQNVVLDLRVLCGTGHAEARVPVRGSVKRAPCGLNGRLPDAHVTAAVFSGATVDMPEILLRTRAKGGQDHTPGQSVLSWGKLGGVAPTGMGDGSWLSCLGF